LTPAMPRVASIRSISFVAERFSAEDSRISPPDHNARHGKTKHPCAGRIK